jgi:hypothetical protein
MKVKIKISRILQVALLFTFFLPFYPEGCDGGKKAQEAKAKSDSIAHVDSIAHADSLKLVDSLLRVNPKINLDSLYKAQNKRVRITDSINNIQKRSTYSIQNKKSTSVIKPDSANQNNSDENSGISKRLSQKSKLLKLVLRPKDGYSGIGFILDEFIAYIVMGGTITGFMFFLIAFIIKIKNFNNIFYLCNIIGLIMTFFNNPSTFTFFIGEGKLWGYWICIFFGIIMIAYDSILLWKLKKNRT